ncbi:MAG: cupin domain-containing protein [Alkalispirochaetaceae bacterium]
MNDTFSSHDASGGGYRWENLPVESYSGSLDIFKGVTKQVLFSGEHGLDSALRYFEVEPGGYSSFERHQHVHGVLILRGRGRCILGEEVRTITAHDRIYIPPMTYHQFQADEDEYLGFLCMVNNDRDRPQRPDDQERRKLKEHPVIGRYLRP